MSVYHLHARLHEGALGHPDARYLFESRESDDLAEVTRAAKELAAGGVHGGRLRPRTPRRAAGRLGLPAASEVPA